MKKLLLCLFAGLPTLATAQTNEAALLKDQHVTQTSIYLGSTLVATERYDRSGNTITSWNDSFLAETIQQSRTQQFNAQNQVVWSKSTHSAMPDTTFWQYHYNERQQLTSVTDGYTGKQVQVLEYNAAGQLVRKALLEPTGGLLSEERFTYDAKGREVEATIEGSGIAGRLKRTTYDHQDWPVQEQLFDRNKLFFTQLTQYQSTGKVSRVTYREGKQTTGVEYTYDPDKRLLSRRHFTRTQGQDITTGQESFTYTPTGLLATFAEDIFSFRHTKRTFTYQYN